ncbi:hypothetical protein L960_5020c [Escherichia coli B7A]|nr:hypothetical protein L960_5020c [Escherichia coli B7A]
MANHGVKMRRKARRCIGLCFGFWPVAAVMRIYRTDFQKLYA